MAPLSMRHQQQRDPADLAVFTMEPCERLLPSWLPVSTCGWTAGGLLLVVRAWEHCCRCLHLPQFAQGSKDVVSHS